MRYIEVDCWGLMVLVLSIATVLILFRFHVFITVLPFECWSVEDIWDYHPNSFNPFWAYGAVFLLLCVWSLLELSIGILAGKSRFVPLFAFLLMASVLFGHLHLWQSFKIMREEKDIDYFTLTLINFNFPQPEVRVAGSPPVWREYVIEKRCGKGLAISTMSNEEWNQIRREYEILWE